MKHDAPAYNPIYLSKAARAVGNMLHDAVIEFCCDSGDYLKRFIQSGITAEIESGNPKYAVGMSGAELFSEVIERTSGKQVGQGVIEVYDRSGVYWVGWALAHYQRYSGRSFRDILEVVSYDELIGLYDTLHEPDVQKAYEVLDAHFDKSEYKLKRIRKRAEVQRDGYSGLNVRGK